MKKLVLSIAALISIATVAQAQPRDGERLACGRIYYKSGQLRGDTASNHNGKGNTAQTQNLMPGHGDGVYRQN